MASSSRRAKRNNKRNNKQQSRSMSQSSNGSQSTAPTYMVEENSQGELVNKRLGVAWPKKVHRVKRYPDYSSGQSLATSDGEDQFKTSPYEMISIAELNAGASASKDDHREKRVVGGRKPRTKTVDSASSPQYVTLSNRSSSEEEEEYDDFWDEPTAQIDSVVFKTAEELRRYQKLFRAATRAARSDTSLVSVKSADEPDETHRHYIGVRSRNSVDRKLKPGQFFIYYDKPSGTEMPVMIELKIGHMTSANEIYHYPIQRFENEGEAYYAVMQTDPDVKVFDSMASLVKHFHTFSDDDHKNKKDQSESFGQPV